MVGQAREPPRQTWHVAAVEGRSRVLVVLVGVLAVVMDRRFLRAKTRVSELDSGGNDWMRQEMDIHNRQRLEKAAEALHAWSLNDRNTSPAPGASPHGSEEGS